MECWDFHAFSILWLHLLFARIVLAGQLCASNILRRVPQNPSARLPIQLIPSTSKNVGPHGIHGIHGVLMVYSGVCVLHERPLKAFAFPGQKSLPARSSETEHRRLQGSPSCQGWRPSHLEALRQVASSAGHWWVHNTFPTKLTVTFNSTWRRTRHFLDLRG